MVDFAKPIQTKDGIPARVVAQDGVWVWIRADGETYGTIWHREAVDDNFVNVPEPKVWWANVYKYGIGGSHRSREEADSFAVDPRQSLLKITYTKGQQPTIEVVWEKE